MRKNSFIIANVFNLTIAKPKNLSLPHGKHPPKKISRQLQKDLSEIFQLEGRTLFSTSFVSVTVVRVSPDLSVARAYLSVFGVENKEELLSEINKMSYAIRKKLAARVRNQIRKVPELKFFLDDSVDYAQKIESLLKN